jgi:glycine/D-amino acid oxidase-like deaminating enzyme
MLHQDVVQMDAQRCVNALETIVRARGGTFIEGEVTGLRQDGGRVQGVTLNDGSTVACETLVLALGGWTGIALSRWLDVSLPIQPYSLQKLHVLPIGAPLGCAVRWQGINIVTRRDGNVHVGSKHEETGLTAQPSEAGKQWLLEGFHTILPGVEINIVEAAAGLAAFIPDPQRTPILGRLPGIDNLYAAVPSTNGFLLSGLMASSLADYLVSGREDPFMRHMHPDRSIGG